MQTSPDNQQSTLNTTSRRPPAVLVEELAATAQRIEAAATSAWNIAGQNAQNIVELNDRLRNHHIDQNLYRTEIEKIRRDLSQVDEASKHAESAYGRARELSQQYPNLQGNLDRLGVATQRITAARQALESAINSDAAARSVARSNDYQSARTLIQDSQRAERERQRQQTANAQQARLIELQNINADWQTYSSRTRSLLEQILNFTTTGREEGVASMYWISGIRGESKCILRSITADRISDAFDLTQINSSAFRIQFLPERELGFGAAGITVIAGDERRNVRKFYLPNSLPNSERLHRAWALALRECPSQTRTAF
jgi:hypothetical protein